MRFSDNSKLFIKKYLILLPNLACRRGEGAFKSKVKTVDKKQKYSFRETDKRLKRLARRMTGKCCLNVRMTCA